MSWWIVDLIIFEHKAIIKSIFWTVLIIGVLLTIWSAAITYSSNYSAKHNQPVVPVAPVTDNPSAAPTMPLVQAVTIDNPSLKRNSHFPVVFTRDPDKDPVGAFFADLNFGLGPFPGVYINVDIWQKAGGRIVVTNAMPVQGIYYTVFTYKGSSQSVIYDRQHNIIYSMSENPEIMQ